MMMLARLQSGGWNGALGHAKGIGRSSDGDDDEECGEFPDAQKVKPLKRAKDWKVDSNPELLFHGNE
jgi:hypothetical protein